MLRLQTTPPGPLSMELRCWVGDRLLRGEPVGAVAVCPPCRTPCSAATWLLLSAYNAARPAMLVLALRNREGCSILCSSGGQTVPAKLTPTMSPSPVLPGLSQYVSAECLLCFTLILGRYTEHNLAGVLELSSSHPWRRCQFRTVDLTSIVRHQYQTPFSPPGVLFDE